MHRFQRARPAGGVQPFWIGTTVFTFLFLALTGPVGAAGSTSPTTPSGTTTTTPANPSSSGTTAPGTGSKAPAATFGIGPASSKTGKLDGRPVLRYLSSPGGSLDDNVIVANYGLRTVVLNLYAIDAVNGDRGAIGYLPKGAPITGAAGWIRIPAVSGSSRITLPPKSKRVLPILLRVPLKATPGDHTAGIILSLTSKVKGSSGQLVDFEQRVALRVGVRVSGDLVSKLHVTGLKAHFDGALNALGRGNVKVNYTIHNDGNVTLGGQQKVKISGPLGTTGSVSALIDVPALLPGNRLAVSTTVKGVLAEFLMAAKVTISPLPIAGDVNPPTQDAVATTKFWAIPWIPAGVVIILLLGMLALLLIRRKRRRAGNGRHSGLSTTKPVPEKVP